MNLLHLLGGRKAVAAFDRWINSPYRRRPKNDVEAIEWAVALLEKHPGVQDNPNSQYWLEILRALAHHAKLDRTHDIPLRPSGEAVRLAREFVADPDKRAQVKVQLASNGWGKLADMIDEAVLVSRELLRITDSRGEA